MPSWRSTSTASAVLSLVVAIEDHFEICFEPEDDELARTLDDVVRIVTMRLEERDDG